MVDTVRAFNPLDTPVVIDQEGRQLAGGEFGDVNPHDPSVWAALEAGRLIYPSSTAAADAPESPADPSPEVLQDTSDVTTGDESPPAPKGPTRKAAR